MYLDNEGDIHHPVIYDVVPRGLFCLLLNQGYCGKYRDEIDAHIKKAGLLTLKMQSPTGEAAYGGRSNQFMHNESMLAAYCEMEASRFYEKGDAETAGKFKAAALLAARRNKNLIGMDEIEEATLKIMVGTEKKSAKITEEEKRKTAYHEAGHAILAHLLETQDPVRRISVIPSGRALGYTLNPPERDRYSVYKNQLKEEISMLLGGRVAEKIIYDDVSGGASNDIMRATQIARNMVTKYGMSDELGTIQFGSEHGSDEVFLGRDFNSQRDYSEATAAKIDAEIKRIIDEAFAKAEEILRANIEKLHFIADFLVKYEVMDDAQFKAAMDDNATMEELAAMIEEKNKRSADENAKAKEEAEKIAKAFEEAANDVEAKLEEEDKANGEEDKKDPEA
jgi:cell division protease FtsH